MRVTAKLAAVRRASIDRFVEIRVRCKLYYLESPNVNKNLQNLSIFFVHLVGAVFGVSRIGTTLRESLYAGG